VVGATGDYVASERGGRGSPPSCACSPPRPVSTEWGNYLSLNDLQASLTASVSARGAATEEQIQGLKRILAAPFRGQHGDRRALVSGGGHPYRPAWDHGMRPSIGDPFRRTRSSPTTPGSAPRAPPRWALRTSRIPQGRARTPTHCPTHTILANTASAGLSV
jgi:hypothetical protein